MAYVTKAQTYTPEVNMPAGHVILFIRHNDDGTHSFVCPMTLPTLVFKTIMITLAEGQLGILEARMPSEV